MERQIPEADWKRWRKVSQAALERYCEKTLAKAVVVAEGDGTGHERYLNLWKFLRKADRKLGDVFDNPRRSVAYAQIAQGVASGIIKRSELAEFTEETQAVIELLTASNPLK
jgi:hypothetical protein